jgi:hypothetical protein
MAHEQPSERIKKSLIFSIQIDESTNTSNLEQPPMYQLAPKVMPPIYFCGNYNRYSVHNNAVG